MSALRVGAPASAVVVHSPTLPTRSWMPHRFAPAGNAPMGDVSGQPSSTSYAESHESPRFAAPATHSLPHAFVTFAFGSSVPQGWTSPRSPLRAAHSHSSAVGNRLPTYRQYASA